MTNKKKFSITAAAICVALFIASTVFFIIRNRDID